MALSESQKREKKRRKRCWEGKQAEIRQQKDISYSDTTKHSHLSGRLATFGGFLVVSMTLVQMSHAEAFVSQWG